MTDNLVAQRLALRPMGDIEKAPPTLSFDRPRTIPLPWADLAASTKTDAEQTMISAADALRRTFEESWGYSPERARSQAEVERILANGFLVTQPPADDNKRRFAPLQLEDGTDSDTDFAPGKGVYAQHSSGRWYRLRAVSELTVESFTTKDLYKAAWAGIVGLELVKDTTAGALSSQPTETEHIDLRAPFIEARYRELVLHRNIAAATYAAAKAAFEDAAKELRVDDEYKQAYFSTARELDRFEQAFKTLARQAAEMDYTIFVEPLPEYKSTKDADGKDVPAAAVKPAPEITLRPIDASGAVGEPVKKKAEYGRLYRRTVERRTYTPTHTVYSIVGWLFPRIQRKTVALPPVTQKIDVHVEVDTLREPHRERIAELRASQFDVHVCNLSDNGYETENGTPLSLVMTQCEADESTRLSTVVFVPGYDFRLTGERVLTGYTVFHRPVAGSTPVTFPELSVRESMEYRTTWLHTEVGELVKAINLAPGERREVTVTRSFQQETTETKTASSVFDLASSESSDLSTVLERTARNETDIVDKMSTSASAGYSTSANGSYSMGPASASASMSANVSGTASASRDKSVKNVGTDMAKSAQKAARSVNQSRKEEVSTSATSRTSISTSDTSVSVIENINQGRTLNLVFHRLYNRYVGRLFLTDLRLNVRSGTEVIAGSGILPERTYSIHELREVVMALEDTPLPIKSDERSGWELRLAILREIGNLIEGEYAKLTAAENAAPKSVFNHPDPTSSGLSGLLMSGSGSDEPAAPTDIVKFGDKLGTVVDGLRAMDLFSVRARGKGDKLATPKELEVIFNERVEALIEQLAPMEVRGLPVNSTELLVAAEGLFMDAQVGANPSTEPYFERVRDAEVAMRWAEVDRVQSESARNGALARYMGVRSLTNGANTVVEARVTGNALEIELLLPLGTGEWRLEHDERTVSGVLANTGGRVVTHDFAGNTPSWATDGDFSLLALVDAATGTRLPFANMLLAPAAR